MMDMLNPEQRAKVTAMKICELEYALDLVTKELRSATPLLSHTHIVMVLRVAIEKHYEQQSRRASDWQDDDSPQAEKTLGVKRLIRFAAIFLLLASSALGQLEVRGAVGSINSEAISQIGHLLLVDVTKLKPGDRIAAFQVTTEAANVEIDVSDANRVSFEPKEVQKNVYIIEKPGQWFIEVVAVDFEKNIWGRKKLVLDLDSGPGPDPGPPPVPPSPVPNEYGIGSVVYQYAPKDAHGASQYAKVFKASAGFLFGVPSLKFITSSTDAHNRDPNRSIQAWMTQEYGKITCTDPATCAAWETWRAKVNEAFLAAQKKKQFTRQDWRNVFNESAKALEYVK